MWTPRRDETFSVLLAEDGTPEGTPITSGRLRAGDTYTLRVRVPSDAVEGLYDVHVFTAEDYEADEPPRVSLVRERARIEHGSWLVGTFTLPAGAVGQAVRVGFVQASARTGVRPERADGWGGETPYSVE